MARDVVLVGYSRTRSKRLDRFYFLKKSIYLFFLSGKYIMEGGRVEAGEHNIL